MYIRRNPRNRFFRDHNRKPSVLRRFMLMLFVILIAGGIAFWQQDMLLDTAVEMLGPEVSPTPLPGELAQIAQSFFLDGDLEASVDMWDRVLAMSPDNIDFLYEAGMILIDLNDDRNNTVERAGEFAMRILELDPDDPRGYALRARSLVWEGNYGLAVTVARVGIDISPAFAPLYAALSRAHIGDGNLREGQEAGIQAIEYGPGDVRSYWAYASSLAFSGAREEAIFEYERTIDVNPSFLPPYFELANLYLASNRDQEAIDAYTRILGVQPTNARALLRQCQAYRKVGQFNQARGLCEDSVVSDPGYIPALFQLGQIQYSNSEFEPADELFQTCVDLDENNLDCIYYLGLTQYYLAKAEYTNICEPQRLTSLDCTAGQICQSGWNLLQDALLMVENGRGTDGDREIITTGLTAIQNDSACRGVIGIPLATPEPEITPESTAEA